MRNKLAYVHPGFILKNIWWNFKLNGFAREAGRVLFSRRSSVSIASEARIQLASQSKLSFGIYPHLFVQSHPARLVMEPKPQALNLSKAAAYWTPH